MPVPPPESQRLADEAAGYEEGASRRQFIRASVLLAMGFASGSVLTACGGGGSDEGGTPAGGAATPSDAVLEGALRASGPFLHGVASGDPLQDRVILWTRVSVAAP
ncbi:MAG TPA: PhoD-like phosphatase N-terminal domain-containing protein, partial [Ramlibacter sp.]|nr:PhoD-like phosphatase N-terminal domain-containing protein [Ramlibacter sp.]